MMNSQLAPVTQFLETGGPVVWLLLAMSILLLTLFVLKLWQFAAAGLFSYRVERRAEATVSLWESGQALQALENAAAGKDPQNRLLAHTASHLYHSSLTGKALEDELSREANGYLSQLRSHLRSIELIAALAPLIGLLGTVLGMIDAFQAMEAAGRQVDPSTLSGGIWVALLTTAVGLIVAIPATVIHNWLERRIEEFANRISDRTGRLLTAKAKRLASPSAAVTDRLELASAHA